MTLVTDTVTTPAPFTGAPTVRLRPLRRAVGVMSGVVTVVIVMVAAVALVLAIATRLSPKGQYLLFGHPVMTVLSGSMAPAIRTGDLIVDDRLTATQAEHIHIGQIASFRDAPGSHTIITHRVVGVDTTGGAVAYVTKGDANNAPDAVHRPASGLIGVFRAAFPRGGYILNALHQPLVLGLLLASPVLWFLSGPLYKLAREMDEPASREPAASAGEAEANAP
jgi:signal peptidase